MRPRKVPEVLAVACDLRLIYPLFLRVFGSPGCSSFAREAHGEYTYEVGVRAESSIFKKFLEAGVKDRTALFQI